MQRKASEITRDKYDQSRLTSRRHVNNIEATNFFRDGSAAASISLSKQLKAFIS